MRKNYETQQIEYRLGDLDGPYASPIYYRFNLDERIYTLPKQGNYNLVWDKKDDKIAPFQATYIITWGDGIKEKVEVTKEFITVNYYYGKKKTLDGISNGYVPYKYNFKTKEYEHPKGSSKGVLRFFFLNDKLMVSAGEEGSTPGKLEAITEEIPPSKQRVQVTEKGTLMYMGVEYIDRDEFYNNNGDAPVDFTHGYAAYKKPNKQHRIMILHNEGHIWS